MGCSLKTRHNIAISFGMQKSLLSLLHELAFSPHLGTIHTPWFQAWLSSPWSSLYPPSWYLRVLRSLATIWAETFLVLGDVLVRMDIMVRLWVRKMNWCCADDTREIYKTIITVGATMDWAVWQTIECRAAVDWKNENTKLRAKGEIRKGLSEFHQRWNVVRQLMINHDCMGDWGLQVSRPEKLMKWLWGDKSFNQR